MDKCSTCTKRYVCDELTTYDCAERSYIFYKEDSQKVRKMNDLISNLYDLFDAAWNENMNGRGTDITRMVTTFVPDAIQDLQAYEWMVEKYENDKKSNC